MFQLQRSSLLFKLATRTAQMRTKLWACLGHPWRLLIFILVFAYILIFVFIFAGCGFGSRRSDRQVKCLRGALARDGKSVGAGQCNQLIDTVAFENVGSVKDAPI